VPFTFSLFPFPPLCIDLRPLLFRSDPSLINATSTPSLSTSSPHGGSRAYYARRLCSRPRSSVVTSPFRFSLAPWFSLYRPGPPERSFTDLYFTRGNLHPGSFAARSSFLAFLLLSALRTGVFIFSETKWFRAPCVFVFSLLSSAKFNCSHLSKLDQRSAPRPSIFSPPLGFS